MASPYIYVHVEPVNYYRDDLQYIVRYPKNTIWPIILENIAKRYLRGNLKEVMVYTVGSIGANGSARVGRNGNLWRDRNGNLMWGSKDHNYPSIIDTMNHRAIPQYSWNRRP